MRRQRRRPIHYHAISLFDGTVIATFPMRKPTPKTIKRDHLKIDEDGICKESFRAGKELSSTLTENRFRFQDIIANRLNARRALRELVLPELAAIREELATVRSQLQCIERTLGGRTSAD